MMNYLDLMRISGVYLVSLYGSIFPGENIAIVNTVTFFMLSIKFLTFLETIESMRYLLKMIYMIISDISTFLAILMMTFVSYAVILTTFEIKNFNTFETISSSYLLAFG